MGININESMDFLISIIIERIDKIKGDKDINPLEKSRKNIILEKKMMMIMIIIMIVVKIFANLILKKYNNLLFKYITNILFIHKILFFNLFYEINFLYYLL